MWVIQVRWAGEWVTVQTGFPTRDHAEWATARWKQANDCRGDPFRAVEVTPAVLAAIGYDDGKAGGGEGGGA